MKRTFLMIVAVLIIGLAVPLAWQQVAAADDGLVRTTWPSNDDPGPPFYARIEPAPPHVINDGSWAAIVFYREPSCVRPDFNLLLFFDFGPAFGCDLTGTGASLWHGEPFIGAPKIATMRGNGAVPVWFVPLSEFNQAAQDGELYISELAELNGLMVGYARQFNEVLHPSALPPELGGGGHPVHKLVQVANGWMEDGSTFNYQATALNGELVAVRIEFR